MHRLVALLVLAVMIASSEVAQLPGQVYWKKVLPNTPMPRAIKNLLKQAGDNVRKDVVVIDNVYVIYQHQSATVMHKGRSVTIDDVYKIYAMVHNGSNTHYDPDIAIFFVEKNIQAGTRMTLHFTDPSVSSAPFISRSEASLIPFTSSKLPEILDHFSIQPNSNEAESMRTTLAECEEPALEGEEKHCTTSLESMIDFSTTTLGSRDVLALSTSVDRENSPKQQYEIISVRAQKKMSGYSSVVCHASSYTYAVFFCHSTVEAKTYQMSLVGKDGTRVEAVATCHTDTSKWDPTYLAFQMLSVKPGTVPICHFLPQNHVVWTPSFK